MICAYSLDTSKGLAMRLGMYFPTSMLGFRSAALILINKLGRASHQPTGIANGRAHQCRAAESLRSHARVLDDLRLSVDAAPSDGKI